MPLSFVVVCEAPADQRTGCDLADRVFCDGIPWIEQDMLAHQRAWRGLRTGDPCLLWRDVPDLARRRGIRAHGHFWGEPGALQAAMVRRALLLVRGADCHADAIVLLRDDDGQPDVRNGFDQARNAGRIGIPVVIGLATTKRECWALAGFEPQNDQERERLGEIRRELGFDPRDGAHKLTAGHDSDKRSAKRILRLLTDGQTQRETDCWSKADLSLLAARGEHTGLAAYLEEVRTQLVPLFGRTTGHC